MVNDSPQERLPSDVMLYYRVESMLLQYEYWFANEPHLIVNENGETFKFKDVGERLEIVRQPELDLNQSEMALFLDYVRKHNIVPEDRP